MVIPDTFGVRGERTIASYNFIEITTGKGIMALNAGKTVDANIILGSTFYSNTVLTSSGNMGVSGNALRINNDFDFELSAPLTIEGQAIISAPIAVRRSGSSNSGFFIFKIRKWDGTTETEIASNQSSTHTNNSISGTTYRMTATDITIPRTHFKIGETLRITIEVWGSGQASPCYVEYAHDPMNRTTGWDATGAVPSKLTFQIPIRINL